MGSVSTYKRKEPQPNSPFDTLPDDVIQLILNRVKDAKTLVRCLTLNKRFASIIPETDVVSLPLFVSQRPHHNNNQNNNGNNNNFSRGNPVNLVKSVVSYLIAKFRRRNNRHSNRGGEGDNSVPDSLCQCAPKLLKPFRRITHLHFELHTIGGTVDKEFLKWKAIYGSELKTCGVLCATSFRRSNDGESVPLKEQQQEDETVPHPPPSVPTEEFKARIMWTISCLISASARHFLLKQMLAQFPTLKTATISDARRQGKLSMGEDEIRDLRESLKEEGATELTAERVVPDLRMRMWYAPELELPAARCVLKGATLLVIGPANSKEEMVPPADIGYDGDAAEQALFAEAQREIVKMKKRSCYVMEMTSF
ncbi:F-box protein At5g46170-like [Arachis stenosperma]|uniref:F-box protein At5g46170-like n=1 Tax=Arachis stenosperma TaxID=217475 RepID=UPI0025ACDCB0|nr:F-box protein At5g46170-like [Arachis stenosperma]